MLTNDILAIFSPIIVAIITYLLTRRKNKADAMGSEISNVAEVAKLWREFSEDMQTRYKELTTEVAKLRGENEALKKQIAEFRKLITSLKIDNKKLMDSQGIGDKIGMAVVAVIMLVGIVILSSGCARKALPTLETHDSLRIDTVERLVEVALPPDSSMVNAYLKCDSLGNVYLAQITQLQGERVKQEFSLANNTLTVKATDSNKQVNHELLVSRNESKQKAVTNTVRVNYLTSWQYFQLWVGRLVIIALAIWFSYRFIIKDKLTTILNLFKKIQ